MQHDIQYRTAASHNAAELAQIHHLNEQEVPNVSSLSREALATLIQGSAHSIVAIEPTNDTIVGFIIAYGPRTAYQSVNYRWFESRYDNHLYIDRIAVSHDYRGYGIGKGLYGALLTVARDYPLMTCEVNVDPPNALSLNFHHRLGFERVGEQHFDNHYVKTVAMLAKPLHTN